MSPDRRKLRQKLDYVRQSLRELRQIRDEGLETFLSDRLRVPAATRLLQVAIEAILDASHHIVAREGWGLPQTYQEALDELVDRGVLPADAKPRFRHMVAFRNRAVHLYEEIEPEQIFAILTDDLGDFDLFLEAITRRYL